MKISGRLIAMQITDREARLLEGIVRGDQVQIVSALHLKNLSGFFEDGRISNLTGLVDHLCLAMRTASFKSNRVLLCYSHELEARLEIEPVQQEKKKWETLLRPRSSGEPPVQGTPAKLTNRHVWGLTSDNSAAVTYLEGDTFLVTALRDEFDAYGFTLVSIDAPDLAVLNMTRIATFSYDAPDKIIVQVTRDQLYCTTLSRDVPVSLAKRQERFGNTLAEQVADLCHHATGTQKLERPWVFVTGPDLTNREYNEVYDYLVREGLNVFDSREVLQSDELCDDEDALEDGIGPAYSTCFALLLKCFDRNPIDLLPQKQKRQPITQKQKQAITRTMLVAAGAFAMVCLSLFGIAGAQVVLQRTDDQEINILEQQLAALQAEQARASNDMRMMDTCDPFVSDVLIAVDDYTTSRLTQRDFAIASIDTADMLPQTEVSAEAEAGDNSLLQRVIQGEAAADPGEEVSVEDNEGGEDMDNVGGEANTEVQHEQAPVSNGGQRAVYIRGYSTQQQVPMNFFSALATKNIGDVRITGIEHSTMSDGDIWVFEMQIRGGDYGE